VLVLLSGSVFAEDDGPDHAKMKGHQMGMEMKKDGMKMDHKMMMHEDKSVSSLSPELKMHLSEMYTKMGECMKTAATIEECQKQVMKDCPVVAELGYCPLMEGTNRMKEKTN